jgi:hypothetical protein
MRPATLPRQRLHKSAAPLPTTWYFVPLKQFWQLGMPKGMP